jgi:Bacteriophage T4 gp9/10-like protein
MTQQTIDTGNVANDGSGDPLRTAFTKTNDNFDELYARVQSTPPATSKGATGDVAGMTSYDSTYFYYCYGTYNGSSNIWKRVTGSTF